MSHIKIPEVQQAQLNLENLKHDLGRLIITGKVADARTRIAGDVFKNMEQTQYTLDILKKTLIEKLIYESMEGVHSEAKGKSEVIINILNRNLFERTADIGFLATDDDIRCFLCGNEGNIQKDTPFILNRLLEYKKKYSVYTNIYIFQPNGKMVVSTNTTSQIDFAHDRFLQESLHPGEKKFIEYFGPSSFQSGNQLFYSYKITTTEEKGAPVIGIMVLEFDFEHEMKMIFESLDYGVENSIHCLLDETGKVLESDVSDLKGTSLQIAVNKGEIVQFHGKDYLSYSSGAQGYQGFQGQKWYGHTMIPLEYAFKNNNQETETDLDIHDILKSQLVGNELRDIIDMVDKLNQDIRYMIINGHLIVSREQNEYANGMKPIFDEVVNISEGCREVFSHSIGNMFHVVIKNLLNDIKSIASLGINIMDRNLYERANDARWWALTSKFKIILERAHHPQSEYDILHKTLGYIHELYTVYHTLFLYDKDGTILSASKLDENGHHMVPQGLIGQNIKMQDFIQRTLNNRQKDSQFYTVSDFCPSNLYDGQGSYIYTAAISSLQNNETVGGIGIVFDSEPQLKQMLWDVLPKQNGKIPEGTFGIFTQRNGKIISTTHPQYPIGSIFKIDSLFLSLKNGESYSNIIQINNEKYIVGSSCSAGYREYKVSDDYKNDILCLVCIKL